MEQSLNADLPQLKITYLSVDEVVPNPRNSRTHSEKQLTKLTNSIKRFGFNESIAINNDNIIIAGHARLEAAKRAGLKEVPTIQLGHLTREEQKAYLIFHNKIALEAGWDNEILKEDFLELTELGFDLEWTGFEKDEIEELTNITDSDMGLTDPDEVPDIGISDPITKRGDVWLLGDHRLMCGDSTMIDDVEKLMDGEKADMVFTDPPYNTGMTSESQKGSGGLWKGNNGSARLSHMFNDSYTPDEWQAFMASFMTSYWMLLKDNAVAYICLDWRRNHELVPHIESVGFKRSNLIVWDKMVHGLGSDYKYTYELINVCKKGKPELDTHQGDDREYSDVWHIQRKIGKNEEHATAKPVEVMERAIRHASKKNNLVADLFGGSGSTLIACEKTNRKCFMMELAPNYCDVIIKRWQKFTGNKAIHESSGIPFEEINNGEFSERDNAGNY